MITGGGALMYGIDKRIEDKTKIPVSYCGGAEALRCSGYGNGPLTTQRYLIEAHG